MQRHHVQLWSDIISSQGSNTVLGKTDLNVLSEEITTSRAKTRIVHSRNEDCHNEVITTSFIQKNNNSIISSTKGSVTKQKKMDFILQIFFPFFFIIILYLFILTIFQSF